MAGPADYIQQGFGQFGSLVQDVGEKSREPHPAIKKRIMEMLHEGKDPRQAAIEAKLEMGGHIGGDSFGDARAAPPQPQMEPYGDGSAPGLQPPPQPMQQFGGRPVMSQPSTMAAPPEPAFTMRDATDAKDLGLLKEGSDTPEDRYARAMLRARVTIGEGEKNRSSRETQTTEKVTAQKDIADAGLDEKKRQFDRHHKLEVDKLEQDWEKAILRARTSIQNAREGHASSKDVAALKAVLGYDSAIQAQITGLTKTSYSGIPMGSSEDLNKRLSALQAQHSAMAPQVQDALQKAQQVMGSSGADSTSEKSSVSVPGSNLKAPDTSVPAGGGMHPARLRTRDGHWVKWNQSKGKYEIDPNQGN